MMTASAAAYRATCGLQSVFRFEIFRILIFWPFGYFGQPDLS